MPTNEAMLNAKYCTEIYSINCASFVSVKVWCLNKSKTAKESTAPATTSKRFKMYINKNILMKNHANRTYLFFKNHNFLKFIIYLR